MARASFGELRQHEVVEDAQLDSRLAKGPYGRRKALGADTPGAGRAGAAPDGNPAVEMDHRAAAGTRAARADVAGDRTVRPRSADTAEPPWARDSRPVTIEDIRLPNLASNETIEGPIAWARPVCPARRPDARPGSAESAGRGPPSDCRGDRAVPPRIPPAARFRRRPSRLARRRGPPRPRRPRRWQSTTRAAIASAAREVFRQETSPLSLRERVGVRASQ